MEVSSSDFLSFVQEIFTIGMCSTTFLFLKWFLAIYAVVVFIDILLLFMIRPMEETLKLGLWGSSERPVASPGSLRREWSRIEKRLNTQSLAEYKVALIEADTFVDRILKEIGYSGSNLGERLENIRPEHFVNIDGLREAHEIRNRIVFDVEFSLDQVEARRVLALFFAFLDEAEVFS